MSLLYRFDDRECRAWFAAAVAIHALPARQPWFESITGSIKDYRRGFTRDEDDAILSAPGMPSMR